MVSPPRDIWQSLEIILVMIWREGVAWGYWHIVWRGQICCYTFYDAQGSPLPVRIIWSKISIVLMLRNPEIHPELHLHD